MASFHDKGVTGMSEIRFSKQHGQNLQLEYDGKTAAWQLNKHGGCCFTKRPLSKGDKLQFILAGSGHVLLGMLGSKPKSIKVLNEDATSLEKKSHWTHFRLKKEVTTVTLHREKSQEILYTRNDGKTSETKTISFPGKEPYICFEILFGDITIEIDCSGGVKKPIFFDKECGINVALEEENYRAQLKNINPSAMCCSNRPLQIGEAVDLDVQAVAEASWTFIKLFIANGNAEETEIQNLQSRTGLDNLLFPRNGIKIDKRGSVQFCVTESGDISYSVNTVAEKVPIGRGVDFSKPVYLYLELFRSRVGMRSTLPEIEDDMYMRIKDTKPLDEMYLTVLPPVDVPDGFPERPVGTSCSTSGYLAMTTTTTAPHQTRPKTIDSDSPNTELKKPVGEDPASHGTADSQSSDTKLKRLGAEAEPQGYNGNSPSTGTHIVKTHGSLTQVKDLGAEPDDLIRGNQGRGDAGRNSDSEIKKDEAELNGTHIVKLDGSLTKVKQLGAERAEHSRGPLSSEIAQENQGSEIRNPPPRPPRPREPEGACGPLPLPPRIPTSGGTDGPGYVNEVPVPSEESPFEKTIRENYTKLLERLEPDQLADLLFEKGNLSRIEHSEYLDLQDRKSKCRVVLKILLCRPSSKETFKHALRSSAQGDILTMLQLE